MPLRLQLKPSRSFLLFLAGGHVLAGVAVCLLPLAFFAKLLLLAALALLGGRLWQCGSHDLPTLLLRDDGKLEFLKEGAEPIVGAVGVDTLVWPWLIVLHAASEEAKLKPLVIFRDGLLEADAHRQLRLWLRWAVALE